MLPLRYRLVSLLLITLLGCERWLLPEKTFPVCEAPAAAGVLATHNRLTTTLRLDRPSAGVAQVRWLFGDGTQLLDTCCTSRPHTYRAAGRYVVSAELINRCGDTVRTARDTVRVSNVVLATVTTQPATDVTLAGATTGLTLSSAGEDTVRQAGICYGPTDPPTLADGVAHVRTMPAPGQTAPLSLTGLLPNTTYYYRAFATNEAGTAYDNTVRSFRTRGLPAVRIADVVARPTDASLTVQIGSAGNPAATRYGLCYSATTSLPTVGSAPSVDLPVPNLTAPNVVTLPNLRPLTTYYVRAFALGGLEPVYSDVVTVSTPNAPVPTAGLMAHYPLDGSATDLSGNGLHGQLVNGPVATTDRRGQPGRALYFDGANDYVDVPDNARLRPATLSVSFWIRPATDVADQTPLQVLGKSQFDNAQHEQYSITLRRLGQRYDVEANIKQNSNCQPSRGWRGLMGPVAYATERWLHIVYTFDGRQGLIYLDGNPNPIAQRLDYASNRIDDCPGGSLRLGIWWQGGPLPFKGAIDDVRLYDRALSPDEVRTLYND